MSETSRPPAVVPPHLPAVAAQWLWLADNARALGIHVTGSKGSGKSRLLGRRIAFFDAYRHVPTLIIDPTGEVIRNLVDRVLSMDRSVQDDMLSRMRYIDIGNPTWTVTTPLYYQLGEESLTTIASRYLNLIRRLDVNLQTASILGWNRVQRVGRTLGIMLAALNLQITEAELLLTHPERFLVQIDQLAAHNRQVEQAAQHFRSVFLPLSVDKRFAEADAFLTKVSAITWDPVLAAMFGGERTSLDWQAFHDDGLIYLIDFSHLEDDESKRLIVTWLFRSFLAAVRHMGKDRPQPISVIVDELTYLLSDASIEADLLTNDLIELVDVLSRNFKLWLTLAHQEMYQVNARVSGSLMTLGTQILGRTTDLETAKRFAEQYYPTDFSKVKKTEPHYMSDPRAEEGYFKTHDTTVEFTTDEQIEQNARRFLTLPTFTFMVAAAAREGAPATRLQRASIQRLDEGQFVNAPLVQEVLEALLAQHLMRTSDSQATITHRHARVLEVSPAEEVNHQKSSKTRRRTEA